jgi:hypothetical protein
MSRCSTDGGTKPGADGRTNNCPCGGILGDRLLRTLTNLLRRPLPASGVIDLKYLKRFPRGW